MKVSLDKGQKGGAEQAKNKTENGDGGEHDGPGLEGFLFRESAEALDYPEATVVHPGERDRAESDGEKTYALW